MVDFDALYDRARFRAAVDLQREALKARLHADCTFGYGGGLFKIDGLLIALVKVLVDAEFDSVILPDINDNPIKIKDAQGFLALILDRHQSALAVYYTKMEELRLARTPKEVVAVSKPD